MSDKLRVTSDEQEVTTAKLQDGERTGGFKDLRVWQKGMELAKAIYCFTQKLPAEEKFDLIAQMRRCAVSIPSNIAAGQARRTTGEFVQFISHAEGSLAELYTQLCLAVELSLCPETAAATSFGLVEELRKMLTLCVVNVSLVTSHLSL